MNRLTSNFQPVVRRGFSAMATPKTNQYYVDLDNDTLVKNYGPLPVALSRGEGIYVWDCEGHRYTDCLAGYGACNQGHVHPKILKAMIGQATKVTQISRNFSSTTLGPFGDYITNLLGYEKFVAGNGGCEADEAACMTARKWGYKVKGIPDNEAMILFPTGNFWGRSITASGACDDFSRYNQFGPFTKGFDLFKYDDVEDLERKFKENPNICAVFLEPIQGEGGIIIPQDGYLQKVRDLCTKYNVLMVTDEIQSGLGRTGYMFAADHEKIRPDMIVMGKALSGGMLPVSGVVGDAHIMNCIQPGEHGNTYCGNPLSMATAHAAMQTLVEEGMIENSKKMGELFTSELRKLNSPLIKEVRGRGLFIGVEIKAEDGIKVDGNHFAKCFFKHGVLTKATHDQTVRLTPPLVINESQIMEIMEIAYKATQDLEALNQSLQ